MDVYNLILNYYNDDNLKSLKEIEEADNKIIYPKDIRHTTLRDFVGKTFKTLPPVYDKDTHTIIKILNPRLALMWDIDKEEEEEDYSYQRREYFALRPISLGKGRYIYLLSDDSRIEAFIVPLKGKTLFLNTTDTAVLTATDRFLSSYKENFIRYDPEESMLLRPKGKRYELINIYNEKVLPGKYDTIYYNEYGIVGIRGNKFELYDSYLQKKEVQRYAECLSLSRWHRDARQARGRVLLYEWRANREVPQNLLFIMRYRVRKSLFFEGRA